jgi:malectin (di-glucose binding ER protein)/uncharacterized protein DUF3472
MRTDGFHTAASPFHVCENRFRSTNLSILASCAIETTLATVSLRSVIATGVCMAPLVAACSAGNSAPMVGELAATLQQAQTADGGTSLSPGDTYAIYSFSTSSTSLGNETIDVTVNVDPGSGSDRFFAYQAGTTLNQNAYIGLVTDLTVNGIYLGKGANFSIWGASGSPDSQCSLFTDEGTGWGCHIAFAWVAGHAYALTMSATATNGTSWTGSIVDTTTKTTTTIGAVTTPAMWLQNPLTFTEYFGSSQPSCADFTESQVTWANPTANNGTISSVVDYTEPGAGNCFHTSTYSSTAGPVTQAEGPIGINAGGPLVAPFLDDEYYSGGGTIDHNNTIDTSGITDPAPQAVYQDARVGNFIYTIPSFSPGDTHLVRLHFAETYFSSAGSRLFNVSINGTQVLTEFDIYKAAGAKNKAVVKAFTETANSSGNYVIQFTSVVNQSLISGIEVQ